MEAINFEDLISSKSSISFDELTRENELKALKSDADIWVFGVRKELKSTSSDGKHHLLTYNLCDNIRDYTSNINVWIKNSDSDTKTKIRFYMNNLTVGCPEIYINSLARFTKFEVKIIGDAPFQAVISYRENRVVRGTSIREIEKPVKYGAFIYKDGVCCNLSAN